MQTIQHNGNGCYWNRVEFQLLYETIIALRYKKYSTKKILKGSFRYKNQNINSYLFVIVFLFLDFCYVAFDGKLALNAWYIQCLFQSNDHFLQMGLKKQGGVCFQPIYDGTPQLYQFNFNYLCFMGIWRIFSCFIGRNIATNAGVWIFAQIVD